MTTWSARSLAAALLLSLALTACTEPSRPVPALDERHVITVDGTTVRYNGRLLDWNADAKRWEEVLGPASREWNGISIWDDLGVLVYHNEGKPKPVALRVALGRTPHSTITDEAPEFWPRKTFRGRLLVDGALIHSGSQIREIQRDKKGIPFRRSYLPTIYDYYVDDFEVRLDFGHDRTLTSFSISPPLIAKAGAQ
ncbi:DUF7738 domain-containing protein [Anaeromyxobacter oryzisoli]|uniref:DUF7738 domain-containing protein n=1 Tax=Anaeromyxobacter oryzisoli TaxID=2925408 RepID=UPI001F587C71|nr:hypothetical protein [Anaeromyxobacter sp. SG63]